MIRGVTKIFRGANKLTRENTAGISFKALWAGIIFSSLIWIILLSSITFLFLLFTNEIIYSINGLLKLITWFVFFLSGFIAAYRAGFKGWLHGLWTGLFLGLISIIFLLEIVPTLINLEVILFQLIASMILGTSGGLAGLNYLQYRKDKKGYSFKEARKGRFDHLS